jgi:protein-S-isoprenylcysteine O-methyltransferase Ste14
MPNRGDKMFLYLVLVASGILVVLGLYLFLKTKRTYDTGKALSIRISLGWWALDLVHCLLVILSSLYNVWPIPVNEIAGLIGGSVMLGVGVILMLIGMIEFRSIGRISGSDTSELVTTGIYQWSRNPQYLGWFLVLLGISLIGSSGLALLCTTIGLILFHLYIARIEEPYLERIFREKYLLYKKESPRYIGKPKRKKASVSAR